MEEKKDVYRKSRVLYIISATLEYFISILTGTAYLAKIAGSIGITDGVIGVLSSFTALGCAFQIVSMAMRTDRAVKPRALTINLINQLCFTLLYVIPVVNLPKDMKTLLFISLLLCGNVLQIDFLPVCYLQMGIFRCYKSIGILLFHFVRLRFEFGRFICFQTSVGGTGHEKTYRCYYG